MKKKHFLTVLFIISLLGLILRLYVSFELAKSDSQVSSPSAVTDMASYKKLSENILKGEIPEFFDYQPFYYLVFLPLIIAFFGKGISGIIIIQSLFGAISVWLTGICSAKLFGKIPGLISAALISFCGIIIFYTPYRLIVNIQSFFMILIFYLLLTALKKRNSSSWGLLGFVSGCSILTRGNIWFFLPVILILALFEGNKKEKNSKANPVYKLKFSIFFLIFLILPQIPFSILNSVHKGEFCGASVAGPKVLAIGNNPNSPPAGNFPEYFPSIFYSSAFKKWSSDTDKVSFTEKIFDWAFQEPLAFIELQVRKLILFWDKREFYNNVSILSNGKDSEVLNLLNSIFSSFLILSSALAGMFIIIFKYYRKPKKLLLFSLICAFWLSTAAFYILSRLRLPVYPLLALSAGQFSASLIYYSRQKALKKLVFFCVIPIIISSFISSYLYDFYRKYEFKIMKFVRPEGTDYVFPDKTRFLSDNGPIILGGWGFLRLKKNLLINKKLPRKTFKSNIINIKMDIISKLPGSVILMINGEKFNFDFEKKGKKKISAEIKTPSDSLISIKCLNSDTESYFAVDRQRNYGRTWLNGKQIDAELVMEAYIPQETD